MSGDKRQGSFENRAVWFGAVLTVVWSCLREKWRMRKVDIADDAEHPGFGVDIYSRKVEEFNANQNTE